MEVPTTPSRQGCCGACRASPRYTKVSRATRVSASFLWDLWSRTAPFVVCFVLAIDVNIHITEYDEVSGEKEARMLEKVLEYDTRTDDSITDIGSLAMPVVSATLVGMAMMQVLLSVGPKFLETAEQTQRASHSGSHPALASIARLTATAPLASRPSVAEAAMRRSTSAAMLLFLSALIDVTTLTRRLVNTEDTGSKEDIMRAYAIIKCGEFITVAGLLWRLQMWCGDPGRAINWKALRAVVLRGGQHSISEVSTDSDDDDAEARAHAAVLGTTSWGDHEGGADGASVSPSGLDASLESETDDSSEFGSSGSSFGLARAAQDMQRAAKMQSYHIRQRSVLRLSHETSADRELGKISNAVGEAARAVAASASFEAGGGLIAMQQRRWRVPVLLLMASLAVSIGWEFRNIINYQGELVPDSVLSELTKHPDAPDDIIRDSPTKVVVILLDGLRYDRAVAVPRFAEMLQDELLAPDFLVHEARARLPAMSIPNWLAILTGAEPELHGVLGNILIPETQLDTMFSVAAAYNLNRGLAASPAFEDIVLSQLPLLGGSAIVDYTYGEDESDVASNFLMDSLLTNTTLEALRTGVPPYRLWLLYNNDIDLQGHCCGVASEWNTDGTYDTAVGDKADNVRRVIDSVDNDTVVIITSDHGHVDPGGHGGIDDHLFSVPLFVYKRGSGLADADLATQPQLRPDEEEADEVWEGQERASTLLDIAVSVTTLLGLPPPGTSEGVPLPFAMHLVPEEDRLAHYQAVLRQQQELYKAVILSVSPSEAARNASRHSEAEPPSDFILATEVPIPDTIEGCAEAIRHLRTQYRAARASIVAEQSLVLMVFSLLVLVIQFAYFLRAVIVDVFVQAPAPRWCCYSCCRGARARESAPPTPADQREATCSLWTSVLLVALFYVLTLATIIVVFYSMGYKKQDSTLLAHESVLEAYFSTTLLASCGLALLFVGGVYATLARVEVDPTRSARVTGVAWIDVAVRWLRSLLRALHRVFAVLHPSDAKFPRLRVLYLVHLFSMAFVCFAVLVTMAVRATYTEATPLGFRMKLLSKDSWVRRFQVMAVQTLTLPLLAALWWGYIHFPRVRPTPTWAVFLLAGKSRYTVSQRRRKRSVVEDADEELEPPGQRALELRRMDGGAITAAGE